MSKETNLLQLEDNLIMEDDQLEALELLYNFIDSSNTFYRISGAAGTGKTTVIKKFIKKDTLKFKSICISAPTHQAKDVISNITGIQGVTLHSLLGIKPEAKLEEYDPKNIIFKVDIRDITITDYDIVIIDEFSMIGTYLYELINKTVNGTKTKIIFLGDKYQLPPVKEVVSPIININGYELTINKRQGSDNPLFNLLEEVRKTQHRTSSFNIPFNNNTLNENEDKGIIVEEGKFFRNICFNYFKKEQTSFKVLAYTNECVSQLNSIFRLDFMLYKYPEYTKDTLPKILIGDKLIGYKTISERNKYGSFVNIIANSKEYIIEDCFPVSISYNHSNFNCTRIVINNDYPNIPINILNKESYTGYIKTHYNLLRNARQDKKQWVNFYDFKKKFVLIENIIDEEDNSVVAYKDIDYGYAITVHKSQGSTYDNIGVYIPDIMKCYEQTLKKKLIYTALSRAKNICVIYG